MNSELFLEVLKHIRKQMNSIKKKRILLLYDNYESHISIEVINYSRGNGIVFLPATSIQPLEVAVFESFKTKLKEYFND